MYHLKTSISIFAIAGMLLSCNQNQEDSQERLSDTISVQEIIPVELKDSISSLAYERYIKLKDVLVNSSAVEAQAAATEFAIALRKVPGTETTALLADKIGTEADIVKQRISFTSLSNEAISIFKNSEISSGSIYVQYCPMANEGEGGYWLSSEEEIMNPYYGDEMLKCGEVKQTFTKSNPKL